MKTHLSSPVTNFPFSGSVSSSGRIAGLGRGVTGCGSLRPSCGRSHQTQSISWSCSVPFLPGIIATRVKRRWALRARNPPRDNPADGAPMALVLPGSQAEPGGLWASCHRTPEPCLRKRTGMLSGTSSSALRTSCFSDSTLLAKRRPPTLFLAAPVGVETTPDDLLSVPASTSQSLFTACARRQSVEAWAGAHPSSLRFHKGTPGPTTAAPTR